MREIDKLKQRMKNVDRNVIEYRMTIKEANTLIAEFDEIQKKLEEKPRPVTPTIQSHEAKSPIVWDGGGFKTR